MTWNHIYQRLKCSRFSPSAWWSGWWAACLRHCPSFAHALDTRRQRREDQRTAALMGAVSPSWLAALRADAEWVGTTWQADKVQGQQRSK